MKRLVAALGLLALCMLTPALNSSPAGEQTISQSCARYCRDNCLAFGEPCCFNGPDICGCC